MKNAILTLFFLSLLVSNPLCAQEAESGTRGSGGITLKNGGMRRGEQLYLGPGANGFLGLGGKNMEASLWGEGAAQEDYQSQGFWLGWRGKYFETGLSGRNEQLDSAFATTTQPTNHLEANLAVTGDDGEGGWAEFRLTQDLISETKDHWGAFRLGAVFAGKGADLLLDVGANGFGNQNQNLYSHSYEAGLGIRIPLTDLGIQLDLRKAIPASTEAESRILTRTGRDQAEATSISLGIYVVP